MEKPLIAPLSTQNIPKYDKFIASHPHGWISAHSGWTKVLESAFPHIQGNTLIIQDKTSGKIFGALPLCCVKSPITGNRLVSMPFSSLCDPILTETELSSLTPALDHLLASSRSSHIEIRATNSKTTQQLSEILTPAHLYKCHTIDLERQLDTIYKSLHRTSVRPYINTASFCGASLRYAETIDDIRSFYRLYSLTRKNLFLPSMPRLFFELIWKTFSSGNHASFLFVEIDKKPVAALMMFKFGNRVSAEAMGWDKNVSKLHAVTALYWEAIKSAHSQGYKIFDFGRTDPSNKNLMDFKSRWGTEVNDLPVFIYPQSAVKRNSTSRMKPLALSLQKILFGMPEPFYGWISEFCYRHLG